MKRAVLAIVVPAVLAVCTTRVIACPDGQYPGPFGMCLPEIGGSVGAGFEHLKKEIPAQLGGNPLEVWINASRNTSINGAQPIPPQIRQSLTGYIGDDVMNIAKFKIGDPGVLNLAGLSIQYGDVSAITLNDVVVFREANDAYNNPSLWAHELTHVKQYRDWGVHNFAISYTRDFNEVESPAYAIGNNYAQWRSSHVIVGPPPILAPPPRLPPGFGMQVCGCWGIIATNTAPEPRCQSGWVRAVTCPGYCQVGAGVPYGWVCE